MNVQEFDKDTAMLFRAAVERKLEEVGNDFGITLKVGRSRMQSKSTMSFELNASVGDDLAIEDTPGGKRFKMYAPGYGLDASKLGKTFRFGGTLYTITGWCLKSRKYCVETERMRDGVTVRFAPDHVRSMV